MKKEAHIMDLDEWLFYEKKKNTIFSRADFARKIRVAVNHLDRMAAGNYPISAPVAYKIWKYTEGKVNGWELMLKYQEKKALQEEAGSEDKN
jgi:plasmid maintenance system antidote protein VapI